MRSRSKKQLNNTSLYLDLAAKLDQDKCQKTHRKGRKFYYGVRSECLIDYAMEMHACVRK